MLLVLPDFAQSIQVLSWGGTLIIQTMYYFAWQAFFCTISVVCLGDKSGQAFCRPTDKWEMRGNAHQVYTVCVLWIWNLDQSVSWYKWIAVGVGVAVTNICNLRSLSKSCVSVVDFEYVQCGNRTLTRAATHALYCGTNKNVKFNMLVGILRWHFI